MKQVPRRNEPVAAVVARPANNQHKEFSWPRCSNGFSHRKPRKLHELVSREALRWAHELHIEQRGLCLVQVLQRRGRLMREIHDERCNERNYARDEHATD